MLLYFDDPVSLTGCAIVPCSLVLSYATSYELVFECVTRNGEQPIDMEALGLSWSAVVTPSFSTTDKPLAKASIAADSVVGNKITVPIDTFSSNFYKYVAGRHAAPAVFSLRGYKIKDVEATCSASFQLWIQVQGRPKQDCIPDELGMLSTALEKEISDRMEADDLLQQEIDQLKDSGTPGSGDMTKAVYDKNGNGIVDSAESIGTATAVQVEDAVSKAHEHANKDTLDKFGESDGELLFDGKELQADTSALEQALATETQERKDADSSLASSITSVSESLSQESTARAEADSKLTSDLEQSVSALQTADTETNQLLAEVKEGLERKIDTETSDRKTTDEQIISSVEDLNSTVSELDAAVSTAQESLTQEISNREAADTQLSTNLELAKTELQQQIHTVAGTVIDSDPAVDLQFEDATLGTGWELNGTVNMLTFFDQVYQLQKLKLRVVSKDQTTTGNVVLVPSINDVEQEAVVVPVSAALAVVEVPVNGSGRLTLSRASEDARDTLKGESGTVGMFITNIWKVSEL